MRKAEIIVTDSPSISTELECLYLPLEEIWKIFTRTAILKNRHLTYHNPEAF